MNVDIYVSNLFISMYIFMFIIMLVFHWHLFMSCAF